MSSSRPQSPQESMNADNAVDGQSNRVPASSSGDGIFSESELEMLGRLSNNSELVVKSQQRGEPDLTSEQKLDELKQLLRVNPIQFITRFGKYLKPADLKCFENLESDGKDNYGLIFHLGELEKSMRAGALEKRLKNRRYEALKKLVETTDYFTEEEMQRRNPILYDQLIGKYHTEEEREAFLQQSYKSSSGSGTTSMPLTDMFLAHLERTPEGASCRRMAQECQQDEEDAADAEYEDEDYDMESAPGPSNGISKEPRTRKKPIEDDNGPREEIEDEEKELLKEEFFTTMYRNFLNGKDEDFDYKTVDDNPDYDCGENLENDEEEKYFEEEEACEVSEPSSDLDDQFQPPVRSSEIESRIEKLSVVSVPDNNDDALKEQTLQMSEDEEDELDKYMREIEKQLHK